MKKRYKNISYISKSHRVELTIWEGDKVYDGYIQLNENEAPTVLQLEQFIEKESNRILSTGELVLTELGDILVYPRDLPNLYNWDKAKFACLSLGDGWRLPTKEELNLLFEDKNRIGGFAADFYWSSTEYVNFIAWTQSFFSGAQTSDYKFNNGRVRAVRDKE